jgi:hypothetical protein
MRRHQLRRLLAIACASALVGLFVWYVRREGRPAPSNRPAEAPTPGFVGSATCRSCHPDQHAAWYDSYHRTMTQLPSEQSVLGDFNNVRLSGQDVDARLFREGGQFMVELNVRNPATSGVFPVALTTGSHNRQAYWLADPESSELMILPFMYLRAEKRWIPRHAGYIGTTGLGPAPEKAIFEGERGRWAVICIKCHTTQGRPEPLDEVGKPLAPRVAEFGISCEACHGPGEAHARGAGGIVNPAALPHDRSSQVCGQCHSVFYHRGPEGHEKWVREGYPFRPGDDLFADPIRYISRGRKELMPDRPAHVTDPAESGSFWPDGMIRVTGREFNGLIESPCYTRGKMSCLSCHQMHQTKDDPRPRAEWAANQLLPKADGNAACTQCHGAFNDASKLTQHTHHAADSPGSNCYNCHMPYTTYGILKAARSHQISSPTVKASLETGRPNACNQCHQDKTLSWSADNLASWYKQPKPKLSKDEEEVAGMALWALKGDAGQRAIAAWSFGWAPALRASGNNWQALYLAQLLDDPYDAVRFIAHRSLKRLPGFGEFDYDFVGPPQKRTADARRARAIWERGAKGPFARPTLIEPAGRVFDADFQRLLKLRDDRPLDISE